MRNQNSESHKTPEETVQSANSPGSDDGVTDVDQFVSDHPALLARVLARGNKEARGHALALIANGGTVSDIDHIQQILEDLKERKRG